MVKKKKNIVQYNRLLYSLLSLLILTWGVIFVYATVDTNSAWHSADQIELTDDFCNQITGYSCGDAPSGGGDITGVTAGTGLSGGGTSGDVILDVRGDALGTCGSGYVCMGGHTHSTSCSCGTCWNTELYTTTLSCICGIQEDCAKQGYYRMCTPSGWKQTSISGCISSCVGCP